jgi:hypothetical protein
VTWRDEEARGRRFDGVQPQFGIAPKNGHWLLLQVLSGLFWRPQRQQNCTAGLSAAAAVPATMGVGDTACPQLEQKLLG